MEKNTKNRISWFEANIHYHFGQVKLIETALTHTSAANEVNKCAEHNERLEYLGDAVLELCISEILYFLHPEAREGELTAIRSRLVNQQSLAKIARTLHLDEVLLLGKGEEAQGGRKKDTILSDAFEALLGAIFLDGGFDAAKIFVQRTFSEQLQEKVIKEKQQDYKSKLQEVTQRLFKDRPLYRLEGSVGPEHDKVFSVILVLPNGATIEASGSSVKRAEQRAAQKALSFLEEKSLLSDSEKH